MMTSSGTYIFEPSLGDLVKMAYRRCGVHATQLTAQHMYDARMEANLLMVDWASDGINLWQVEQSSVALVDGTASYAMPSNCVFLLDVYISTGTTTVTDRLISPISRSDYASIATKASEGYPTSYWFDRKIAPYIYLWPVPNATSTYTLNFYYMRQAQDSELLNGTEQEIPWYYLSSFVAGLAAKLALIYAPDRADRLANEAQKAWTRALDVGSENVPVQVLPQFRGYYR